MFASKSRTKSPCWSATAKPVPEIAGRCTAMAPTIGRFTGSERPDSQVRPSAPTTIQWSPTEVTWEPGSVGPARTALRDRWTPALMSYWSTWLVTAE